MKHATLLGLAAALAATTALGDDAPAPNPHVPAAFGMAPVPDAELADFRGGTTISSLNDLKGSLYDNSALDTVTGGNFVTGGALAGSSGFSTVIQNSGNNVLIQNAMILNLQVQ